MNITPSTRGRTVIVKSTFTEDEKIIEVTAVSYTAWKTTLYVVLYFVFVIVSIIITNILLLRWLGKSIMIPLKRASTLYAQNIGRRFG